MTSASRQHSRGVSLLEVMATMAVMLLGVAAAMTVVSQTSKANRRTLTANQAQLIAERTLESIQARGCTPAPSACANIAGLDGNREVFYQTAAGDLLRQPPSAPGAIARQYEVAVDVDAEFLASSLEGGAAGVGEPAVNRDLTSTGLKGNVANVRVSVSWEEPEREGRQVVVLQTRMAP
ncbi:type IV pilus modification PilV family protein [Corallococcus aberystwythensis]|uniref:Prepilin-type N-terminal cleavage/methylation domain-containing protein n=1 Tax=Corallococcus aberystwythensis TaxID=2316722 RepID=A0A3A8PU09_9BACT|nr:prepilin-type N-terminal cleavage/methylation domain-containing protein [Corallococcus aberystwythensis]RKH59458.1 prepilin-type N-terminal cleavage/methylation domain-containing protein [Corallococcus aberystwythensis]